MGIESITVCISLAGVVIAFAVFISNSRKDAGKNEAFLAQIKTGLDFVSNDLKEMRSDWKSVDKNLHETREIALRAEASAKSAHRRIDRAGIDNCQD